MGKTFKLTFSLVDGQQKTVEFEVPEGEKGKSAYEYAKEGGYTGTEEDFAKKMAQDIVNSTETDPTVPEWAKKATKPSYTKDEVGLGNVDNVRQYSASNKPPYPVTSVNGKTGAVKLSAADVGARPSDWMPSAEDVGALPSTYTPPNQTAEQVGADPKGTAAAAVSGHNTSTDAHGDIRQELQALTARLNAFFDSDDQTLDELSEIVAYITSNKTLIDAITTSKVSIADIIDNLTTNVSNKPLSAAQGVVLKGLIDALSNSLSIYALKSAIPTKVSQLQNDSKYLTQHQDISHLLPKTELPTAINTALAQAKASGEFNGKNGKDGYTPIPGVDYNTPADQEAIVQQVIAALGTPVFGTVDVDKNITLSIDHLVDGTYKLGYEDKDGNWVELCTLNKAGEPTWVNIIPLAINTDFSPYVGPNEEKGYKPNTRINTSYEEKTQNGVDTTGYYPAVVSDTFYFYNVGLFSDGVKYRKFVFYDSNFATLAQINMDGIYEARTSEYIAPYVDFSEDGHLKSINFECLGYWYGVDVEKKIAYVRLCTSTITSDSVITKNERME